MRVLYWISKRTGKPYIGRTMRKTATNTGTGPSDAEWIVPGTEKEEE